MIRFLAICAVTAYLALAVYCLFSPDGSDQMIWPTHKTRMALMMPPKGRPR